RDVPAVEALDVTPERAEQLFALDRGIADDHGLAAAEVETRHCCLVRHAAREAQDVADRVAFRGGVVQSAPPERRTERGVVDPDDRAQAHVVVPAEDQLLVTEAGHLVEDAHAVPFFEWGRRISAIPATRPLGCATSAGWLSN